MKNTMKFENNKNQEQPTELSAKEMVAENKKLFAELC